MKSCSAIVFFLLFSMGFLPSPAQTCPPDSQEARVTRVVSYPQGGSSAGIGDRIQVSGQNLCAWLAKRADAMDKIRLFIKGIPITGSAPTLGGSGDSVFLIYRLSRDSLSNNAWKVFYPTDASAIKVSVSIGSEGEKPLPTDCRSFLLILIRSNCRIAFFVVSALFLGLMYWLGKSTSLLRDDSSKGKAGPFSLARVQLAFWTLLVSLSFLYIWATTGDFATIEGSTLVLLAISLGTATAATVIDKQQQDQVRHQEELSEGLLTDILSDSNGLSMHRFQMVVWTIILGVIFVYDVRLNLSMPQFNDNLLALMGISSGAYIGLKIPENKGTAAAPEKAAPEKAAAAPASVSPT